MNCRLVEHEDKRCIKCTECSYKKDRRNRPWIYEHSLNQGNYKRNVVEETVENKESLDNWM